MDYGKQYCHDSPSMVESSLQLAIIEAINSAMSPKEELMQYITDTFIQEIVTTPDSTSTLGEIKRRLEELEAEFDTMLANPPGENLEAYMNRFQAIKDEMAALKEQREKISAQLRKNVEAQERVRRTTIALEKADHHMNEWCEETIRQLVHTVKVISADHIKVILNDGTEIHQEVRE